MYLIYSVLGLGMSALAIISIVDGNILSAVVLLAAVCTFLALAKWKEALPVPAWTQSRFKNGHRVQCGIGLMLFAIAMLQFGLVARTLWAIYYLHEKTASFDMIDIFFGLILTFLAVALIGFEKLAAALFMEFWFSATLAAAFLRFFFGDEVNHHSTLTVSAYVTAFIIVFLLGQWRQWSKGFALGGMIAMSVSYLAVYLTM